VTKRRLWPYCADSAAEVMASQRSALGGRGQPLRGDGIGDVGHSVRMIPARSSGCRQHVIWCFSRSRSTICAKHPAAKTCPLGADEINDRRRSPSQMPCSNPRMSTDARGMGQARSHSSLRAGPPECGGNGGTWSAASVKCAGDCSSGSAPRRRGCIIADGDPRADAFAITGRDSWKKRWQSGSAPVRNRADAAASVSDPRQTPDRRVQEGYQPPPRQQLCELPPLRGVDRHPWGYGSRHESGPVAFRRRSSRSSMASKRRLCAAAS